MDATLVIEGIILMAAGAVGGNIFAKVTTFTLGTLMNSIMGALGGAIGGFIFQGLGAALTSGGLGAGPLLLQAAIGAVSGAILTVIASLFWNPIEY
jgi:uncharacterized membrane protein YeaQ/YmgE (transglycosylase-associated protein family)